uniref:Multifunctional methyltransferase subunit TRM112-like protein n=1 Tax=Trieres chinensis TaxID=1514140 RepID=A0A6U1U391_TRICV|mmetsp:Transcript_1987/g.4442  ORF Transcript_1987/g.4442 Transcript_1987/m.4442 type:complete len:134 (+) Transcript_1987:409-810(+)|eukprot:CAMPEP_0183311030 /NCGR_PEP_ID=MMETSP0160_2-20130417/34755_1 /TAXON_ID=2839 ORGANISM="Odontella Sinensis, Strain Grunow 1884" /NCGR_SAMPLE_ID=MMETSP0160_2 /ASSEMBLY_ACC=CAM_ASM_000250 /LENGTH=133 /DNA_ID=CAMNT_0025475489 /DNA_START=213 /DNA_END=614 /DNA_ORIENTATION=+
MRLLTHNYLMSNVKGAEKGYPLNIEATKIDFEESPVDREMVLKLLSKIEYGALFGASRQIAPLCDRPLPEIPDEIDTSVEGWEAKLDDSTILNLHRVLFDVHVIEGHLVCPDTGRKFAVLEGIPNMILHEDEI